MRKCGKCNCVKEITQFNKKVTTADGISYHCKQCEQSAHKLHYQQNKDTYKLRAQQRRKVLAEQFQQWKQTLQCSICGEKDSCCLDFHLLLFLAPETSKM